MKTATLRQLRTLTALLLVPMAALGGPPLDTFDQRKHWILDTVAANPEAWIKANKQEDNPFFAASACFARGRDAKGREIARKGYEFWTAHPKPNWSAKDADERRKTGAADLDNRNNLRLVDFFRLWPARGLRPWAARRKPVGSSSRQGFAARCHAWETHANLRHGNVENRAKR